MAWASHPTRKQESLFTIPIIQMGARVYLPTVGRFAQVDPIEDGSVNNYAYAVDPINQEDYSGEFLPLFAAIANIVTFVAVTVIKLSRTPQVVQAANQVTAFISRVANSAGNAIARAVAPLRTAIKISGNAGNKAQNAARTVSGSSASKTNLATSSRDAQRFLNNKLPDVKLQYIARDAVSNNTARPVPMQINDALYNGGGWMKMQRSYDLGQSRFNIHFFYNGKTNDIMQIKIVEITTKIERSQ